MRFLKLFGVSAGQDDRLSYELVETYELAEIALAKEVRYMLQNPQFTSEAEAAAEVWLAALNTSFQSNNANAVAELFLEDGEWRDLVALSGVLQTLDMASDLAQMLLAAVARAGARNFSVDYARTAPRLVNRGGRDVVEAILRFDTELGTGEGLIRLVRATGETGYRAWSLMTALDELNAVPPHVPTPESDPFNVGADLDAPNWLDLRSRARAYANRDPEVLVVGGGHAGICAAAWLGHLGIDTLVVDTMKRIGDNWRTRYHNLKLHNERDSNHLPFLPFPRNWPRYIAKDKIANWLEAYVEIMEINFWLETRFDGARYIAEDGCWDATLYLADGTKRTLRPRHIVMATSVSGTPKFPDIATLVNFQGTCVHSSAFKNGDDWSGRKALVFGTGTSAHDIAQNLHENGAHVTMVQRSPTLVVSVEPGAQAYDAILLTDGPPIEDRDLYNLGTPLGQLTVAHKLLTDKVREWDKDLLDGLEKAGFRLEFGEGDTGWALKYRTRGGGYYFNIGCSEYIIAGDIGLIQYDEIATFTETGVIMSDGTTHAADLIILATGYHGQEDLVRQLFGDAVANRVGPIWGFGDGKELRNMWTATAQPGLWFTAGSFSQCRAFSKFVALQIAMDLNALQVGAVS